MVDHENNLQGYNLALSHGISSIIIFLSRIVKNGMINEKINEMLHGAVSYVLSQEKDIIQFGSYFPSFIFKESPKSVSKSRLAWCYGDLGIGLALWNAGKAIDKVEWKEKGLEVLLHSTQRRTFDESLVVDAGICHGSVGIVMIYRRIFFETLCEEFKNASEYWITQTLHYSRFENGLIGYKAFIKGEWVCDYSFLMGVSGIGLVLLSFLQDDQQNWDEMFLLS